MPNYGFVRIGSAVPVVHLADPDANAQELISIAKQAASAGVQVLATPELSLTGYSIGDLVHQPTLLLAAQRALRDYLRQTDTLNLVTVLGMPLSVDDQLFNVAVVCAGAKVVAVIPKSYLPDYKEFEEERWYAPAARLRSRVVRLAGSAVPIGTDLLVKLESCAATLGIEVCEDIFMPIQPAAKAALAGANILINLSASPELVAKARYRRELVTNLSGRAIAAYVYAGAGVTESTRDVVFSGHALIAENGSLLGESPRFSREPQLLIRDVDVDRLVRERMVTGSFGECAQQNRVEFRTVSAPIMHWGVRGGTSLQRHIDPNPFVPSNPDLLRENCEEVFTIAANGLATRLARVKSVTKQEVHIGVSGGLDSTLALMIAARAFDLLGWDRTGIKALTMPGFGTTERTRGNAHKLCKALGVPIEEQSIVAAAETILRAGRHEPCHNCLACENAQARVRTNILMNRGFTIGTGDLSEIALGWCTYGGDQLSMYHVNASIPKTLVQFVIRTAAELDLFGNRAKKVLLDVLDTPISPELLPANDEGGIEQRTEEIIGPYELHDFYLFHILRNGYGPQKLVFLAEHAFTGAYDRTTIIKWLRIFYRRFFQNQFKRSAAPDGPKVGTVSLSQRGDWRMPSDATATLWLAELDGLS